jgi:chromosome segregation ATPase
VRLEAQVRYLERDEATLRQQLASAEQREQTHKEAEQAWHGEMEREQEAGAKSRAEAGRAAMLQQQVAMLSQQVDEMTSLREANAAKDVQIVTQRHTLEARVSEHATKESAVVNELTTTRAELAELERRYQSEVEEQGRAHAALFVELGELQRNRMAKDGEAATWREKGREIHTDLMILQEQQRSRAKERFQLRTQCKEQRATIEQLTGRVEVLVAEVKVAADTETIFTAQVDRLEVQRGELDNQTRRLESSVTSLTTERDVATERADDLDKTLERLRAQHRGVVAEEAIQRGESGRVRFEILGLKRREEGLEAQAAAMRIEEERLKEELREARDHAEERTSENARAEKRHQHATAQLELDAQVQKVSMTQMVSHTTELERTVHAKESAMQAALRRWQEVEGQLQTAEASSRQGHLEARGEAKRWQGEALALAGQCKKKDGQLASLERRSGQALAEAQRHVLKLDEWLVAAKQEVHEHEARLGEATGERSKLELAGETLTEQVRVAVVRETEWRERCTRAEKRGSELQESMTTLTATITSERKHAADSFDASDAKETKFTQRNEELEKELRALKADVTAKLAAVQMQRNEQVAALVTEVSRLRDMGSALQSALTEGGLSSEAEIQALLAEVGRKEASMRTQADRIQKLSDAMADHQAQAEEGTARLESQRAELATKVSEQTATNGMLTAQVTQLRARLEDEEAASEQALGVRAAQAAKAKAELLVLTDRCTASSRHTEELTERLATAQGDKHALTMEIDKAALAAAVVQRDTADRERQHISTVGTLTATIADKDKYCLELTLRVQTLEASVATQVDKLDALQQELYVAEDQANHQSAEVLRLSSAVADQADTIQGLKDELSEARLAITRSIPKAKHQSMVRELEQRGEETVRRKEDQHTAGLARLTAENMALQDALTLQVSSNQEQIALVQGGFERQREFLGEECRRLEAVFATEQLTARQAMAAGLGRHTAHLRTKDNTHKAEMAVETQARAALETARGELAERLKSVEASLGEERRRVQGLQEAVRDILHDNQALQAVVFGSESKSSTNDNGGTPLDGQRTITEAQDKLKLSLARFEALMPPVPTVPIPKPVMEMEMDAHSLEQVHFFTLLSACIALTLLSPPIALILISRCSRTALILL